jgi:hypothetical protein
MFQTSAEAAEDVLASGPQTSGAKLVSYSQEEFRENYDRRPFLVQHSLSTHPLFTLHSLVELAQRLPPGQVKYNRGTLDVKDNLDLAPGNGLSVEETIRGIEHCRSWMVLKYVEADPAYRELLVDCLREVRKDSEPIDPGMCEEHGFIFITSPESITPCHIDPEVNFLLQVRGSKVMNIFNPDDREIISETQLEDFLTAENFGAVSYREEFQSRAYAAELRPGVGVHCPVTAPHWVQNGPEVSISFSITFRTPRTRRRSLVYQMNGKLRRAGIEPLPFARSLWMDSAKASLMRCMSAAQHILPKR